MQSYLKVDRWVRFSSHAPASRQMWRCVDTFDVRRCITRFQRPREAVDRQMDGKWRELLSERKRMGKRRTSREWERDGEKGNESLKKKKNKRRKKVHSESDQNVLQHLSTLWFGQFFSSHLSEYKQISSFAVELQRSLKKRTDQVHRNHPFISDSIMHVDRRRRDLDRTKFSLACKQEHSYLGLTSLDFLNLIRPNDWLSVAAKR